MQQKQVQFLVSPPSMHPRILDFDPLGSIKIEYKNIEFEKRGNGKAKWGTKFKANFT